MEINHDDEKSGNRTVLSRKAVMKRSQSARDIGAESSPYTIGLGRLKSCTYVPTIVCNTLLFPIRTAYVRVPLDH